MLGCDIAQYRRNGKASTCCSLKYSYWNQHGCVKRQILALNDDRRWDNLRLFTEPLVVHQLHSGEGISRWSAAAKIHSESDVPR